MGNYIWFSKPKNCFNSCRKNIFRVKRGESQRESCDSPAPRGQLEEKCQNKGRKEGREGEREEGLRRNRKENFKKPEACRVLNIKRKSEDAKVKLV